MNVFTELLSIDLAKKVVISTLLFLIVFVSVFAFMLVPKRAQAFLGIGDFTFNFTVGDIPRLAWQVLQAALARFLTNLLQQALNYVLNAIKSNFLVRNFLRYEALLTNRRYLDDYLNLYFPGDQHISTRALLRRYVAAVNSGGLFVDTSLAAELTSRADDARGYRVEDLDPSDPNYLGKLTRQAEIFSSPTAWYFLLQDQAWKAESEAQKASGLNLTSEGLKSAFDPKKGGQNILTAQSELSALYQGAADAIFDKLGGGGGTLISSIGSIVGNIMSAFVSKQVLAAGGIYDEFSDFLDPNVDPLLPLCPLGNCDVTLNAPIEYNRPPIPDFCSASIGGGARTDLGTGSASATGGTGGAGGSGGSDPAGGSTGGAGGSGGTGGNADVTLDLQNDFGITPSPGVPGCAGATSLGDANDRIADMENAVLRP